MAENNHSVNTDISQDGTISSGGLIKDEIQSEPQFLPYVHVNISINGPLTHANTIPTFQDETQLEKCTAISVSMNNLQELPEQTGALNTVIKEENLSIDDLDNSAYRNDALCTQGMSYTSSTTNMNGTYASTVIGILPENIPPGFQGEIKRERCATISNSMQDLQELPTETNASNISVLNTVIKEENLPIDDLDNSADRNDSLYVKGMSHAASTSNKNETDASDVIGIVPENIPPVLQGEIKRERCATISNSMQDLQELPTETNASNISVLNTVIKEENLSIDDLDNSVYQNDAVCLKDLDGASSVTNRNGTDESAANCISPDNGLSTFQVNNKFENCASISVSMNSLQEIPEEASASNICALRIIINGQTLSITDSDNGTVRNDVLCANELVYASGSKHGNGTYVSTVIDGLPNSVLRDDIANSHNNKIIDIATNNNDSPKYAKGNGDNGLLYNNGNTGGDVEEVSPGADDNNASPIAKRRKYDKVRYSSKNRAKKYFLRGSSRPTNFSIFSNSDNVTSITIGKSAVPSMTIHSNVERMSSNKYDGDREEDVDLVSEVKSGDDFDGRLLLITDRKQLEGNEKLTCSETMQGNGNVQCGLCLKRFVNKYGWKIHLKDHYGIGWIVGDKDININDFYTVFQHIDEYYRVVASNLKCQMCRKTVRSSMGMLNHIRICGTNIEIITCVFCKREFTKSSITSHQMSCVKYSYKNLIKDGKEKCFRSSKRELKRRSRDEKGKEMTKSTPSMESELTDDSHKAARSMKSNLILRQFCYINKLIRYNPPFNLDQYASEMVKCKKIICPKAQCIFLGTTLEELKKHLHDTNHTPSEGFMCVTCNNGQTYVSKKLAQFHVITEHEHEHDLSACISVAAKLNYEHDTNLKDVAKDNGRARKNIVKVTSFAPKNYINRRIVGPIKKVLSQRSNNLNDDIFAKWIEFVSNNYSEKPLFMEDGMTKYAVVGSFGDLYTINIRPKESMSMKFKVSEKKSFDYLKESGHGNHNSLQASCTKLCTFHGLRTSDSVLSFVGGAVLFVRWVPLPDDLNDQYLLVCFEDKDYFKRNDDEASETSMYSTTLLVYKITNIKDDLPIVQLHYGFMILEAPIYDADFLPSGGYNSESNRLGLVAVATKSCETAVYALPLTVDSSSTKLYSDNFSHVNIIKLNPVFILSVCLGSTNWLYNGACLQIRWSQAKNHDYVFASFSSGYIGIWNINGGTNISRVVINGVINYVPLNYFYTGDKYPNHLDVHYDANGPRWLAVIVMYRNLLIYDIRDLTSPICILNDLLRNVVRAIDWSPIWETLSVGLGDCFLNFGCNFGVINPMSVNFIQQRVQSMACAVSQLHYSPYRNIYFCAGDNGDVLAINSKELSLDRPTGKKFGNRHYISTLQLRLVKNDELVELQTQTPSTEELFNVSEDNYYLVFGPLFPLLEKHRNAFLDTDRRCVPLQLLHMVRVNSLRCNNNRMGSHFMAVGYGNGFIRIFRTDEVFRDIANKRKTP